MQFSYDALQVLPACLADLLWNRQVARFERVTCFATAKEAVAKAIRGDFIVPTEKDLREFPQGFSLESGAGARVLRLRLHFIHAAGTPLWEVTRVYSDHE